MSPSPLDPVRSLFGEQLQELAGGVVSGELPLTTAVVNHLIARKLATANAPIDGAEIETRPAESFTVHLRPKGPLPLLKIDATIEQQPELPARPVLGVRWTLRGIGPLAMLAAPLISRFKSLPPGVTIDRDWLWVNVHTLLQSLGYGEVIPFLTGVRVRTMDRGFVVQFELRR